MATFTGEHGLASYRLGGNNAHYPLLATSPLRGQGYGDAGDVRGCVFGSGDQRGASKSNNNCDLGAVQYYAHSPPPVTPTPTARPTQQQLRSSGGSADPAPTKTARRGPPTGVVLNTQGYRLHAIYGLGSGVEFQRIGPVNVGIQSILDLGFLDGIDVWSYVEQGVMVCFPQVGQVVFLDSAYTPRRPEMAADVTYTDDGHTCAFTNRAGTFVLTERAIGSPAPRSLEPGQALSSCMVMLKEAVNLRNEPDGAEGATSVPGFSLLTALRRASDWFKIDYQGAQGWISADSVSQHGNCAGGQSERAGSTALASVGVDPGHALSDCMVTTTTRLNFRAAPNGAIAGNAVPASATLTALRRTSGWFKVEFHGAQGWISAAHVSQHGNCA